jgi:hypothetical protein
MEVRGQLRPGSKSSVYCYVTVNQRYSLPVKKGRTISITGRETSRLPHFLDNRLTDGGEVVSLTHRPAALYPQEDSWY